MTRRIIPPIVIDWNRRGKVTLPVSCFKGETLFMDASAILDRFFEYPAPAKYQPKFEVGEIVAVAQAYKDTWGNPDFLFAHKPGWNNKMFVSADLMPHQIRITNVWAERLQDISEEDCLREGIYEVPFCEFAWDDNGKTFKTAREAFATLIDKVSGKGTWESNPWAFANEFELVK